jgi:Outer membrane efflux protein
MAVVPTGLPSALIERRPDVRRSEAALMAANASVGVAKAAFFPQISLTGLFGATSTALTSFLQGPATIWSLGGEAVQPLYAGGAITSGYELAWAQRNEAELAYKQTVLNAFGDVANSLVGYNQARLYRMKIEEQTKTYQETANHANVRFAGGVTSFLEVLVTQQQYFTSQVTLAAAWNAEMQNYVQLYQALAEAGSRKLFLGVRARLRSARRTIGSPMSRSFGEGCGESDPRLEPPRPLGSSPKIKGQNPENQTLVATETLETTFDLTEIGPLPSHGHFFLNTNRG